MFLRSIIVKNSRKRLILHSSKIHPWAEIKQNFTTVQHQDESSSENDQSRSRSNRCGLFFGALFGSTLVAVKFSKTARAETEKITDANNSRANLPTYSRAEVSKHKTASDKIWVTYKVSLDKTTASKIKLHK